MRPKILIVDGKIIDKLPNRDCVVEIYILAERINHTVRVKKKEKVKQLEIL